MAAPASGAAFAWYSGSSSPWSDTGSFVDSIGSSLSGAVSSASTAPVRQVDQAAGVLRAAVVVAAEAAAGNQPRGARFRTRVGSSLYPFRLAARNPVSRPI